MQFKRLLLLLENKGGVISCDLRVHIDLTKYEHGVLQHFVHLVHLLIAVVLLNRQVHVSLDRGQLLLQFSQLRMDLIERHRLLFDLAVHL